MVRSLLATGLAWLVLAAPAAAAPRDVLLVGNNWEGTADIVDPERFERIARLDIVPDRAERMAEIQADPAAYGYFLGIRELVGEGHDQFVDDMFTSPDGRFAYVSRPSFADVVGLELATGRIAWRVKVDGYRADHMALSPDGSRLVVSASTARLVDVIDPRSGAIVGRFPSGDQPHENNYSRDGTRIFHASIGTVFTATDDPLLDATKGERVFQVVDAGTLQVLRRIDMGQKLDEAGYPDMSGAVRPMALSPDEQTVFFQVSFFHGFVEYDLAADRVVRLAHLPLSEEAARLRRDEYVLDSAHHGLTMNPEGTKLCAAGTMSDYAAIVDRTTFGHEIVNVGEKPYWTTNSGDGRHCFVSVSGDDRVSVIAYASGKEVARIPVGDHPQRMRMGKLAVAALAALPPARGKGARKPRLRVRVRPRRVRAGAPVRLRVRVTARRGGARAPVQGARVRVARHRAVTDRAGRATLRLGAARRLPVRAEHAGYRAGKARLRIRR